MEHNTNTTTQASVPADDIASLKRHLPQGRFHYQDIASAQARQNAQQRWPLLRELRNALNTGPARQGMVAPLIQPDTGL